MTFNRRRSFASFALLAGIALWADVPGMRPRPDARNYPASARVPHAVVAAAALTPNQVRNGFAADFNDGYLVLEVAVYPDHDIRVSPEDFMLRVGGQGEIIRPAEPAAVARAIQGKNAPKQASRRTVDVYPTASIGYESGTYNDPVTGRRQRTSGVYSSAGVGVEVGGIGNNPGSPSNTSAEHDRGVVEAELFDKSLPEGLISSPAAGYLYFPVPRKKLKGGAGLELQYIGQSSNVKLAVPSPASH